MNSPLMSQAAMPATENPLARPAQLSRLAAADGHQIPLRHWAHPAPRAVIQISHGMAEHSGCYEDVAAQLLAAGYAVLAHDHRAHGLATAQAELGNVRPLQHWSGIIADMAVVNQHAHELYPGLPLYLLGHSMGSFISLRFAELQPQAISALLLEGSNFEAPWFCRIARVLARLECWRQGEDGRSPVIHSLTFGGFNRTVKNPRTAFDWVSRHPGFVDRYVADPLCGFQCSNAYWRDFLGGLAELYGQPALRGIRADLPIYLFAGEKDPVGKMGRGVQALHRALTKAGAQNATLTLYPEARHDLLHETNAPAVMADLLAWLAQR